MAPGYPSTTVVMMGGTGAMAVPLTITPLLPPVNRGATVDTITTRRMMVFFFTMAIMLLTLTVMLVVFSSIGLFDQGPSSYTCLVGPIVLMALILFFSFLPSTFTMSFDKQRRIVHWRSRRVIWFCFSQSGTFSFDDIIDVRVSMSKMRVNGMPYMNVDVVLRSGAPITLDTVNMMEAQSRAIGWKAYLTEIGVRSMTLGQVM